MWKLSGLAFAVAALLASAHLALAAGGATCVDKSGSQHHYGSDGSQCLASSDGSATASAKAKGNNDLAEADQSNSGKAHAKSSGPGTEAISEAYANCKSTTTGSGTNSYAFAYCNVSGQFATAKATNGGLAEGYGSTSPVCVANGGTAMVKSSGGNCKKP